MASLGDATRRIVGSSRPHVVLVMGKGGVGKTTFTIMLGLALSEGGSRVLMVSLDQAMHMEEYLGLESRNKVYRVSENLYAMQVDIEVKARRVGDEYATLIQQVIPGLKVLNVESVTSMVKHAPGFEEEVYLRELERLYSEGGYDYIVVDTPPTGLTFRILSLPRLYFFWIERLAEIRERIVSLRYVIARSAGLEYKIDDPVLSKLEELRERYGRLMERMSSPDHTSFALVATPEPLPVYEASKTASFLREVGMKAKMVVANRVIEDSLARRLGIYEVQRDSLSRLMNINCGGPCLRLLIPQSKRPPHSLEAVKELLPTVKILSYT